MVSRADYDVAIVGGGFYGCCLALFLRTICDKVVVIEAEDELLTRASRVNQARVHSGFHYPRSFATALRSRLLQERFSRDFESALMSDFDMLYAIASRRSKVTGSRFARMFASIDAPFYRAPQSVKGLFDKALIEDVFVCREVAFDWTVLRDHVLTRLERAGVTVLTGSRVDALSLPAGGAVAHFADGREVFAGTLFNVTYAGLNKIADLAGLRPLALKHELAELALVTPPTELERFGVTVMDGPFFSAMPYPSAGLYSLTHVRYTPHFSWVDQPGGPSPYDVAEGLSHQSRWRHMVHDARRYMPCLDDLTYERSLFDVKTVLVRNERDDGRPILLHRHPDAPQVYSVMGAKIDNIYDLFEALPLLDPVWRDAHDGLLLP